MIDTIFIARHGYRINWDTTHWESKTGLPRDPPLAVHGERQAQELADYFLSLPVEDRPTAIFSSPYYRCLQTAKPTARALQVPIYVEHGLSEWYSPVVPGSGLHPRPGPASALQVFFPEIDDSWSSIWYPSRKGEDVAEVHDRVEGLLKALLPEVERKFAGRHRRILLVSHAATIVALARGLLGERTRPLRVGTCSLTEMAPRKDVAQVIGGWEARLLADGSHLKEGASRDWGFEDIIVKDGKVISDAGSRGEEEEEDEPVGLQLPDVSARM